MRLNPDCIRDILLTVEEVTDFWTAFEYPNSEYERLNVYSKTDVLSHLEQCKFQKLIVGYSFDMSQSVSVDDLSPKGHEILENIRTNTNWNKIKKVFLESSNQTLNNLISVAISTFTTNNFDI